MILSFAALAATLMAPTPTEPPLTTDPVIAALEKTAGLRFDELFPRKSNFGRTASELEWSNDARYLTYVWSPYDTKGGNDLYVYDTQTKKSTRLTSPETMG
ncbi:MAG TPA: hypothetical protein VGE01_00190, partial [Fimbriimonas sp.]